MSDLIIRDVEGNELERFELNGGQEIKPIRSVEVDAGAFDDVTVYVEFDEELLS